MAHFTIAPAMTETWWFKALCGALLLSAAYLAYRWHINRMSRQMAHRLQERVRVVRVVSGDSGPDGPGLKTVPLPTSLDGEHAGTPQHIDAGSYVIVDHPEAFGDLSRFTLQAFIQPTRVPIRPAPARQVIVGTWAQDRSAGFALMLDETGALAFLHGGTVVSTRVPLTARRWYHVGATVDLVAGNVTLRQTPLADHAPSLEPP